MRINRAIGLALVILLFQFLVPRIFNAMEDATVSFFHTSGTSFEVLESSVLKGSEKLPIPTIK